MMFTHVPLMLRSDATDALGRADLQRLAGHSSRSPSAGRIEPV
jgi:hypothetical protein